MTRALLTAVGCMGGGSESQPTADTETGNETDNSTTGETATEAELVEVPSPELIFRTNSGVLRVVHMDDERITDERTDEVYVTVDDERTATWVTDSDKGGGFPISAGNFLEIESAESDSTVGVVQVGSEDAEEVLAAYEIGTGETATTTTTNETMANKTTTNEIATNKTTMTTTTEAITSFSNETSN